MVILTEKVKEMDDSEALQSSWIVAIKKYFINYSLLNANTMRKQKTKSFFSFSGHINNSPGLLTDAEVGLQQLWTKCWEATDIMLMHTRWRRPGNMKLGRPL